MSRIQVSLGMSFAMEAPTTQKQQRTLQRIRAAGMELAASDATRIDWSHLSDVAAAFETLVSIKRRAIASRGSQSS